MKLGTCLLLALCASSAARAGLLASENFDYQQGASLNGQNGGSGWADAWTTPGGLDATISAGLSFGDLVASAGAVSTAGFQPPNDGSSVAYFSRDLATSLGADNTTVFLSFLLQPDAGYGFYGGLNFGNVFIGVSGNQSFFGLEGPTNDLSLSAVPVVAGQAVFLVLEADFLPGNDQLSLYVNPTPGLAQPASPDAAKTDLDVGSVSGVVINNYGGFTVDEIRIGSSFDSVDPVPEPRAWFGLAGAMLVGLAARRRLRAA